MPADFAAYEAARALVGRAGPWLVWPAVASAWAAVALSAGPRRESGPDPAARGTALSFIFLGGGFLLLAWYHWRIYATLPLELPADAGDWLNRRLASMGARAVGSLGPVDWSDPPRFAIPLWIEGEKFYFWTMVTALVATWEERRSHSCYRAALRAILALQVTGMAIWDNPMSPPLPQFHEEIGRWFSGDVIDRVGYFFQIFPRMKFYYNASYMWIHPPMLFVAYAVLAATFAASLFSLRDPDPELDRAGYAWARVGYLLLTAGMLVGYPWAIIAWGPNWWWDPKIASSIMMWLMYSAYLHQRFLNQYRGGRAQTASLGLLCYASLLFTYFMSWFFPGEHTF